MVIDSLAFEKRGAAMSETVTHKDLARKLKVSETTIKSYRRKFADCIPVASKGKPIRFLPEAVAVCTMIRDLFDRGMSVAEVRARLAQEFSWVSLMDKEDPEEPATAAAMPQEFTTSLSSLAKSMVTLLQQQNAIVDRLERLEQCLGDSAAFAALPREGSVKVADFTAVLEDLQGYLRNALMPLQQLQRLAEIQGVADVLHQSARNIADAAQIMRSLSTREGAAPEVSSKVVPFPVPAAHPSATAPPHAPPQDPPRAFLLKPMVVRTMDGTYIGAGGKTRGRFTLNDFKALLVYGRQPGEHFSLHWEQAGAEWGATLIREGGDKSGTWRLHFKEAMSQSGVGVVELIRFVDKDQSVHPAEFCAFVADLAET